MKRGRAVPATEEDVILGEHTRDDGSRVRIAHVADDEIVPWPVNVPVLAMRQSGRRIG